MLNSLASAAGLSRPKKKFHFDVSFTLEKLLNCTYVAGQIFAKIRLVDAGNYNTYKFTDQSKSCDVKDHTVGWSELFEFHCKMYGSPVTGELEPCCCKVSVRKESKGGRSYKKLGYVKINLAEYAGGGVVQRKYLLESYNEHKHKPDNSILTVTVCLHQTSGDSVFIAPRSVDPLWELGEVPEEDQLNSTSLRHSYTSSSRISAASSALSFYSPNVTMETNEPAHLGGPLSLDVLSNGVAALERAGQVKEEGWESKDTSVGVASESVGVVNSAGEGMKVAGVRRVIRDECGSGSLQDIRPVGGVPRKTSSACNLRDTSNMNGSKDLNVVDEKDSLATPSDRSPLGPLPSLANRLKTRAGSFDSGSPPASDIHSHTIGGTRFPLPPGGGIATHRRLSSWSQASNGKSPAGMHRRQQSLVSGQSSKSTSGYSTLSERSTAGGVVEGAGGGVVEGDLVSGSLRGRHGVLSSRVEQSRVDPQAVVDSLFSSHMLSSSEAALSGRDQEGLKIYVDKSRGTVMLSGTSLDRHHGNLQAIDVSSHSPKRRRSKKDTRHSKDRSVRGTSPSEVTPPPHGSFIPGPLVGPSAGILGGVAQDQKDPVELLPVPPRTRANSGSSSSDSTKTLTPCR